MANERKIRVQTGGPRGGLSRGWILLISFAIVVAFSGGASRYDAIQIVPLRGLSALFLAGALFLLTKAELKKETVLVAFFSSFTLIVALQLVPIPPGLWQILQERFDLSHIDTARRLEGTWRPLTLTPMRTWNVLGSLVVPAAALLLAIALRVSAKTLLQIVAGFGVLNAFIGLLQITIDGSGTFYLYAITNRGSPVGILANENHAAILAACSMLVIAQLGLKARRRSGALGERLLYPVSFLFILFLSLVSGSRAGFLAAIGAMSISMIMLVLEPGHQQSRPLGGAIQRWSDRRAHAVVIVTAISVLLLATSFLAFDRAPAFRDILQKDNLEDLRWSLWPIIIKMLGKHWLLGTGFGSFEQVYHIYEPTALLMPPYINQAHNDWAQLVIEGGVLAGGLVVGLLIWMGAKVGAIGCHRGQRVDAVFWASVIVIIAVASLVDYPLRTPLFQVVTIWLLLALSRSARERMVP